MSFDIMEPKAIKIDNLVKTDITVANPKGSVNVVISGGVTPYSYKWSGPDGFTSTQQNIAGLKKGCYTLTVTDANDCLFVADPICIEDKTSETSDSDGESLFRISPNPAGEYIILEVFSLQYLNPETEVIDINGKKMQTYDQVLTDGQYSVKIDISHFSQGFYCLRVRDKNGRYNRNFKFVKI
jgi:hypothetical protein